MSSSGRDEQSRFAQAIAGHAADDGSQAQAVLSRFLSSAHQERRKPANAAAAAAAARAQANADRRGEFMKAFEQCINQFSELGRQLGVDLAEVWDIAADWPSSALPNLQKQFEAMSTLQKAVAVICLAATVALLSWLAWKSIALLWPKLVAFIESEAAASILTQAANILEFINDSGLVEKFGKMLSNAVGGLGEEGTDQDEIMETDVSEEMGGILTDIKAQIPFISTITLIKAFFGFLNNKS